MSGSKDDDDMPELDELVARAMAKRGELVPTTTEEVLGSGEDLEFTGELPTSLRAFSPPSSAKRARTEATPARRSNVIPIGVAFALGAAVAAAAAFALMAERRDAREAPLADRSTRETQGASVDTSASARPPEVRAIGPVASCDDCCAGSDCAAAKPELASCPTGRACVSCADPAAPDAAYRLRLGNFHSTTNIDARSLAALDVCVRVGGSPWSCEPAYLDATSRPVGRLLPMTSRAEDLTSSVELELRLRGTDKTYGSWRSALRLNANMFCRGVGVVVEDAKGEHMGGLSLFVEDAFYVEIARAPTLEALSTHRRRLTFADVVPSTVASKSGGHVLVVGPVSKPIAEKLRAALLSVGETAGITMGGDHAGLPERLP